jgi:hypothetical protein
MTAPERVGKSWMQSNFASGPPQHLLAPHGEQVGLPRSFGGHQADADFPAHIAAGRGDVPLVKLRRRC